MVVRVVSVIVIGDGVVLVDSQDWGRVRVDLRVVRRGCILMVMLI